MTWRSTAPLLLAILGVIVSARAAAPSFRGFEADGAQDLWPAEANGRTTPRPAINAAPAISSPVRIDGRLDDAAWQTAPAGTGFRVWDPNRGAIPSEETVFKVVYDRDAVYFGVACHEKDPSKVSAKLSRRDRFSNSDLVSVYIDPYNDHTTGYNFKVNPYGVQMDSYVYNDGEQDQDWDAVWQAETYRDTDGWYAEIRIPFSAVRYRRAPEMTWGLEVYRYMHGRGEDTAWVTWDRSIPGFVSRFGELKGLRDIPAPRQLEIVPFTVGRLTDPAITPDRPAPGQPGPADVVDGHGNFGADIKYGVTADLTLNATVQPDFGQVEADPATLNLSPFETFFDEKRPFFVEGNKFFSQKDFNLFYSRRIGTGDENSRIRAAGKLTGKAGGQTTVALLGAATDLAGEDQAHNLFKDGRLASQYLVARVGRDFDHGRHAINLMGTAVRRGESRPGLISQGLSPRGADFHSRDAYTGGLDFDLSIHDRAWLLHGALVGSAIDHETDSAAPDDGRTDYGTGGRMELTRRSGQWRGSLAGRWETRRLDLNDVGYIQAPDRKIVGAWLGYKVNAREGRGRFNSGDINFNLERSWIDSGREGRDINTGEVAWGYGAGHPQETEVNVNGWAQWRSYRESWFGVEWLPRGTRRYETRGGPLISEPSTVGGWAGASTDTRKDFVVNVEANHFRDVEQNHESNISLSVKWNQSSRLNHNLSTNFHDRSDDTQYLDTVPTAEHPGARGIGGLSYLFGDIHQQTLDITLRSNVLFGRNTSLELYLQPFVTVGDYSRVRELARPDSYDLADFPGARPADYDFSYASANLNAVWRWEYRPGSTIFLVWTHSRERFDQRGIHGAGFDNSIAAHPLFQNEPTNSVLAKVTYWLPI